MRHESTHAVRPAFLTEIRCAVERVKTGLPQCRRVPDVVKPGRGHERIHRVGRNRDAQRVRPGGDRRQMAEAVGVLAHDSRGEVASPRDERVRHDTEIYAPGPATWREVRHRSQPPPEAMHTLRSWPGCCRSRIASTPT